MDDVEPRRVKRLKRSSDELESLRKRARAAQAPEANLSSLPTELKHLVATELLESYLRSGYSQDMGDLLSLQVVSKEWRAIVEAQLGFKEINKLTEHATNLADKIYELSAADKQKYGPHDIGGQELAIQNGPNAGLLKQSVRDKIANDILHQKDEFDQAHDILAWVPYMDQMDGSNRHKLLSKALDIYAEASPSRNQGETRFFAARNVAAGALQIAHEFLTVDHKATIENVRARSDLDNEVFGKEHQEIARIIVQLRGTNGLTQNPYRNKGSGDDFSEFLDVEIHKLEDFNEAPSPKRADERAEIVKRFAIVVKVACHDLSDPLDASALEGIYSKATIFAKQIYLETKYEAEHGGSLADRAKQIAPIAGYLEHAERDEISRDILAEKDKIAQASALAELAPGLREFEDTYRKPLLDRAAELFAAPRPNENEAPSSDLTPKAPYTKAAVALQVNVSHLTDDQKALIKQTCRESWYHQKIFTEAFYETAAVVEAEEGERGVRNHPYRGIDPIEKLAEYFRDNVDKMQVLPDDTEPDLGVIRSHRQAIADAASRSGNNARAQLLAQSRERRERDVGR